MSPYLQPLITYVEQSLLPFLDPCFKWFKEGGVPHRLCLNNLVIQVCLNIINRGQYGNASVPVEDGVGADGFKVLQKGLQVVLEHLAEEDARVWGDGEAKYISHIVLVALSKAWGCKE